MRSEGTAGAQNEAGCDCTVLFSETVRLSRKEGVRIVYSAKLAHSLDLSYRRRTEDLGLCHWSGCRWLLEAPQRHLE